MPRYSRRHEVQIWPLCFELTDYEAMKAAIKQIFVSKIPWISW
jgi:3-oxoacyl-[acyl-carrier protein] reductase